MTEQDPFRTPPPARRAETPATAAMPQPFATQETPSWAPQEGSVNAADAGAAAAAPSGQADGQAWSQPGHSAQAGYSAQPGYSGQPAYGAQPPAYAAPPQPYRDGQPGYDGVSIAALVTGILTVPLVAIVLGAVGLRRTAAGMRKGTWMAVTGLVLGLLATIAWTGLLVGVIVAGVNFAEDNSDVFDELGAYSDAQVYGDDAELDALYDQCVAGDDGACDDLYYASAPGSEYEAMAEDCGGRGMPTLQWACEQ